MMWWVAVVILTTMVVAGADYDTDPEWSFQVYMNESTTLVCNDSLSNIIAGDEVWWNIPDGGQIHGYSGRNDERHELIDDNGIRGGILKIKQVEWNDVGLYMCMVSRNGIFYRKINRGLNLYGPLPVDGFERYKDRVFIAGMSSGIFFFLITFCCCHSCFGSSPASEEKGDEAVISDEQVVLEDVYHHRRTSIFNIKSSSSKYVINDLSDYVRDIDHQETIVEEEVWTTASPEPDSCIDFSYTNPVYRSFDMKDDNTAGKVSSIRYHPNIKLEFSTINPAFEETFL